MVFDTSAMLKLLKNEAGHESVSTILASAVGRTRCLASILSIHELVWSVGRSDLKATASAVSYFEEVLKFVPQDSKDAVNSANLRLRYRHLGLSSADAFIIQLGIDNAAEIITCDKAWLGVKEAKVRVV